MAKTSTIRAFGKLKVVQAEDKFRAARDKQLMEKLERQKDLLMHWFANTYSDMELKIHLILSRSPQELQVRKELKYYSHKDRNNIVALTDVVDSHTWYNPYLMEKYVDGFVEVHTNSIQKIIERSGK